MFGSSMKKLPLTILWTFGLLLCTYAQSAALKAAEAACPNDYHILFFKVGDINQDGQTDLIAIYASNSEEITSIENEKRIVEIFLNQDGQYLSQGRNENLVFYYGYDENFPESFVDAVIINGQIWIQQYGGSIIGGVGKYDYPFVKQQRKSCL
jgi:hypothetical protein